MTTIIDTPGEASIRVDDQNQQPAATGTGYSFGESTFYSKTRRTGGDGAYGTALFFHTVEATVAAGEFDSGLTALMSSEAIEGGQQFGGWVGVNSPSSGASHTFSTGGVIGQEVNVGNRWSDPGYQNYPGSGPRFYTGLNVVPDVVPSQDEAPPVEHYPGSFGVNISKSIHDHKWWVGVLVNWNTIMPDGHAFNVFGSGSAGA